jgi:hypothetical protein
VVADQAHHDILAEDEASWADPDAVSDRLASGLLAVIEMRNTGRYPRFFDNAELNRELHDYLDSFPAHMTPIQAREWARGAQAKQSPRRSLAARTKLTVRPAFGRSMSLTLPTPIATAWLGRLISRAN